MPRVYYLQIVVIELIVQGKKKIDQLRSTIFMIFYISSSGGSRISPRKGRQLSGGCQHTIFPNFPKNCMKWKEFGPPGGRASKILPCRSATVKTSQSKISPSHDHLYSFIKICSFVSIVQPSSPHVLVFASIASIRNIKANRTVPKL